MPEARHDLTAIYEQALQIESAEDRRTFLIQACGEDVETRHRLEKMLAAASQMGTFLESPAAELGITAVHDLAQALDNPHAGAGGNSVPPVPDLASFPFLKPSTRPDRLGQLGSYEVIEVIGQGGMGTVFKAFDPRLCCNKAIKVLPPHLAANALARQRFLDEAKRQASISHEHVVAIHAVDDIGGYPFIVMEYIVGVSLQERIKRSGPMQPVEILRIALQTAYGLAAAHKRGLVHRDIKPANILLENGVERVKIADFGLARAVDDLHITQSGVVPGTPEYMSPEQARGQAVDARSDLFSLGAVMYAMCTGRSPFRASSVPDAMRRVAEDVPRPIHEINPAIPRWMAEIIECLLAKDREDRFQSAEELAQVLESYLVHLQRPTQVSLPRSLRHYRQRGFTRHKWRVAAVLLMATLIVGVVAGLSWLYRNPPSVADKGGAPPEGEEYIDLKSLVSMPRDEPQGRWRVLPSGMLCNEIATTDGATAAYWSLVKIPYVMPSEYDLTLKAQRTGGSGVLEIAFSRPGEILKARIGNELDQGLSTIRCEVRQGSDSESLRVYCDGVPIEPIERQRRDDEMWPRLEDGIVALFSCPQQATMLKIVDILLTPLSEDGRPILSPPQVSRDRAVAEEVLWRGGYVTVSIAGGELARVNNLRDLPNGDFKLAGVNLNAPANANGLTDFFAGLDDLASIDLRCQSLTEAELLSLLSLPTDVPGSTAERSVSPLVSLGQLDLSFTAITDEGLRSVGALSQLRRLRLAGTNVSEVGLGSLSSVTNLAELDLSGTNVTDAVSELLAKMPHLQSIALNHTAISDHALGALESLEQLVQLSLMHTGVSDQCIPQVSKLKALRAISLVGSQLTASGLQSLAMSRSDVMIEHSTGAPIDLLAIIRNRVKLTDGWSQEDDGTLVSPFSMSGLLVEIPYEIPRDYCLTTELVSPPSYWRSVKWNVPCGDAATLVDVDSWPQIGCLSGLFSVDGCSHSGKPMRNEATVTGQVLAANQNVVFNITVRGHQICAASDERLIVDWEGDPGRLSSPIGSPDDRGNMSLLTFQTNCRFTKLQLIPIERHAPAQTAENE